MADKDTLNAARRHAKADTANLPPERRPERPEATSESTSVDKSSTAPSTSSVMWAEWRRGLKDLQNAVLNPFPDHAAQHEEPGSIANPTQLEVYQEKHNETPGQEYDPGEFARGGPANPPSRGRGR